MLTSGETAIDGMKPPGPILEKTIKGAYLVSMDLVYDEFHDPLAGYGYTCRQILVMDGNFNVVAMIVEAISVVS